MDKLSVNFFKLLLCALSLGLVIPMHVLHADHKGIANQKIECRQQNRHHKKSHCRSSHHHHYNKRYSYIKRVSESGSPQTRHRSYSSS